MFGIGSIYKIKNKTFEKHYDQMIEEWRQYQELEAMRSAMRAAMNHMTEMFDELRNARKIF